MRCPIVNSAGTARAEMPISSSDPAYNHNGGKEIFWPYRRMRIPAASEPIPKPPINAERTIETIGVVTPYWAIARRSQTSSYNIPQKPEIKKKMKYQSITGLILISEVSAIEKSSHGQLCFSHVELEDWNECN